MTIKYLIPFFLQDIVICFVTVVAIFCGTIPSAVYAGQLVASTVFPGAGGAMVGVAVSKLFYIPFTALA